MCARWLSLVHVPKWGACHVHHVEFGGVCPRFGISGASQYTFAHHRPDPITTDTCCSLLAFPIPMQKVTWAPLPPLKTWGTRPSCVWTQWHPHPHHPPPFKYHPLTTNDHRPLCIRVCICMMSKPPNFFARVGVGTLEKLENGTRRRCTGEKRQGIRYLEHAITHHPPVEPQGSLA